MTDYEAEETFMFVPGRVVRGNGEVNVFSLAHSVRIMALATCIAGILVCGSASFASADVSTPQAQDNNLGNVPLGRPFHNWDAVAQCESGGRWHIATGNGYYGGLQFSPRTWHSFGGVGNPALASREYQIMIAERVLAKQGIKAWPVCGPRLYGLPARRQPKGIFPTWNFPILHSIFPWLPF